MPKISGGIARGIQCLLDPICGQNAGELSAFWIPSVAKTRGNCVPFGSRLRRRGSLKRNPSCVCRIVTTAGKIKKIEVDVERMRQSGVEIQNEKLM